MKKLKCILFVFTILLLGISNCYADNLSTCLSGKYPSLCNKSQLNAAQRQQAESAERTENLNTCLTGKYPTLCNRYLLNSNEMKLVAEAERRENKKTCLDGRYPTLCNYQLLSKEDAVNVQNAENRENLKTCLDGRYPTLCKKNVLTVDQKRQVDEAERKVRAEPKISQPIRRSKGGCESGHWVDEVFSDGEFVKLEDGSVWKIDIGDQIDTMLWLPTTDIIVCPYQLINTDDKEKAGAVRIK